MFTYVWSVHWSLAFGICVRIAVYMDVTCMQQLQQYILVLCWPHGECKTFFRHSHLQGVLTHSVNLDLPSLFQRTTRVSGCVHMYFQIMQCVCVLVHE